MIFTNCSDLKKGLGIEKDIPDEFMVKKSNPIERPPNYDLLPPDTKNNGDIKSPQNKTNDNIISILDSATNQNPENQKKGK